jgi:general secretion pathway protein F
MPTYRYRALTQVGEIVSGSLQAPSAAELMKRIEYLGLIPIEPITAQSGAQIERRRQSLFATRPRGEDVTIFTGDLALLLRTGARINEALELLGSDADNGRMRSTAAAIAAAILSGESFGEAIAHHPQIFPPIYVAMTRVGEASGTLAPILEAMSAERQRAEAVRRRLSDTLRYPAFLVLAASGVLLFFLTFVLPQFAGVFRDFDANLAPVLVAFLGLSNFLRSNAQALGAGLLCAIILAWFLSRRPSVRGFALRTVARLPLVRPVISYHRTTLFCRNLGLLLSSGVTLVASLRILGDMMETTGDTRLWTKIAEDVRHGGKLSDALSATKLLPPTAVRTLRLGEESGELPMLAVRIADFYDAKLQRSLDRVVGFAGPLAIVMISLIIGGLIVSVMTALLSINQAVG